MLFVVRVGFTFISAFRVDFMVLRRAAIYISLKTDSLEVAKEKAPKVWREVLASWELIASGQLAEANERYELAKQLAQRMGVNF